MQFNQYLRCLFAKIPGTAARLPGTTAGTSCKGLLGFPVD